MEKIVKRIDRLYNIYPERIDIFKPIDDEKKVKFYEEFLSIKIDKQFIELCKYSNGMGFIDYCLLGFGNKKTGDFSMSNYSIWSGMPELKQKFVVFMSALGGVDFGYIADDNNDIHKVGYRKDSYSDEYEIIADSVEEFFGKFLDKIEVVLKTLKPNDIVGQ